MLLVLVVVWTVIFIIFGIAMVIILAGLKKSIDKINQILENANQLTQSLNTPAKAAASAAGVVMGLIEKFRDNRSPKKVRTVK